MTPLRKVDYIKQFWVGLMDGDGSIQVNHWRKKSLQYRFVIKLANLPANVNMLQLIAKVIGGYVSIVKSKDKSFVIWKTDDQKVIKSILPVFDLYPPLTTRMTCQLTFMKECFKHSDVNRYLRERESKFSQQNNLIKTRNTTFSIPIYFNAWLSGFIEAEGCFCIRRKGSPSFSIGQNSDKYLLEAINTHFNGTNQVLSKGRASLSLTRPDCDFYILEIYRKSVILEILEHFTSNPLLGQKSVSLNLFRLYIMSPINQRPKLLCDPKAL